MSAVTIGSTRSRTRITREGEFEEYLEVEFFVDDARHKLEMSPKDFTAASALAAVKKAAAELVALKDKKVTI